MIEFLENRRFLSTSVANGVLTITGTDKADHINVVQRGAAIIVHQGSAISRFSKKDHISKIVVNALGGNDQIKVTSKLAATIDGGDGKDLIVGGAGADVLMGGNGNDRILGGTGNDSISGGAGRDAIFGGAGDDMIDAFDAEADQLTGGAGKDSARVDSQTDMAWNIEDYLAVTTNTAGAVTDVSESSGELRVSASNLTLAAVTTAGTSRVLLSNSSILGGTGAINGSVATNSSNYTTIDYGGAGTSGFASLRTYSANLSLAEGIVDSSLHLNGTIVLNRNCSTNPGLTSIGDLNFDGQVTIDDFLSMPFILNTTVSIPSTCNAVIPVSALIDTMNNPGTSQDGPISIVPEAPATDPVVITAPAEETAQTSPAEQLAGSDEPSADQATIDVLA